MRPPRRLLRQPGPGGLVPKRAIGARGPLLRVRSEATSASGAIEGWSARSGGGQHCPSQRGYRLPVPRVCRQSSPEPGTSCRHPHEHPAWRCSLLARGPSEASTPPRRYVSTLDLRSACARSRRSLRMSGRCVHRCPELSAKFARPRPRHAARRQFAPGWQRSQQVSGRCH